jgi:hypothetical protein
MPSILRFPANQEDPDDLPDAAEQTFVPPPDLVEQPNPPRGTAAIRRSSATIVPEASFDEPTRPSEHPGPDLDEFPWFENTAPSAPPREDDPVDASVDPSADTAAMPSLQTEVLPEPPRTTLPLLLAASAVMILLAGTAVMLVIAMLQKPEPAQTSTPVVSTMVAPPEALPAPTIAVPAPVEAAPAPAPVKRTKKKAPSIEDVAPPAVTVTTPAIEAPKEPEAPAAAPEASGTDEKKKKGLFGKKKDR